MTQSFGFWRIALSSFVAVFIALMIAPVISFHKSELWFSAQTGGVNSQGLIIKIIKTLFLYRVYNDL